MSTNLLSRAGCLVIEDSLPAAYCSQLLKEADGSGFSAARLVGSDGTERVDEFYRQTKTARISAGSSSKLSDWLLDLKPSIEVHFGVQLIGCEIPQLLVYTEGDFFAAHRDITETKQETIKTRKVSVVIFLNEQGDSKSHGKYRGGNLTLYGIINQPGWEEIGFPIAGKTGLLVAFLSNTLHEVKPITSGTRYTVVSWYF